MATEEEVVAGLTDWINSLDLATHVESVQDYSTGHVIWALLQRIDHEAFHGTLPEDVTQLNNHDKDSWVRRWNNLKYIYQSLELYLADTIGLDFPLFERNPDLQAIAQHGARDDIITLLKLCVVAAANCSDRISFLQGMQHLDKPTQLVLMATLQATHTSDEGSEEDIECHKPRSEDLTELSVQGSPRTEKVSSDTEGVVSDLAFEERLAKVIADNQRIEREKQDTQRRLQDLKSQYESLQHSYDQTQEELARANDRLDAVLAGRSEVAGKIDEARHSTVIAALEARVAEADVELTELKKDTEVFRLRADRAQKLQDDYDEIKIERDKLSRKANATEKYKVKLEAVQNMEKEIMILRTKVTDLQTQVQQGDTSRAFSTDLQREIHEYRRILPNIEQERYELNEMKKKLELDFNTLSARYSDSEDQLQRSRREVEELQGRLRDHDKAHVPSRLENTFGKMNVDNLETEEADFTAAEARLARTLRDDSWTVEGSLPESGDLEPGNDISEDELQAIISAMRAQTQAGTTQERESARRGQQRLVALLEKARSRNDGLVQHIKKQAEVITGLQSKVDATDIVNAEAKRARAGKDLSELEEQLDTQDVLIANLKMEIKLICSAWYEQNQRIGTLGGAGRAGIATLMRSRASDMGKGHLEIEKPTSFLGKQRRLVNSALMGTNVSRG